MNSSFRRIVPIVLLLACCHPPECGLAQPGTETNQPSRGRLVPPGGQVLRDLEYGRADGKPALLNLYLPAKSDKLLPLIIWIHGGAWRAGSKDNSSPALRYTGEGYAVAHVGYRLTQEAIFPAQIHDCKAAVRWLRANAGKYGLDSDRFIAWGGSAGGHLVALLGVSDGVPELEGTVNVLTQSSRVQAVIDWFGPADFLHHHTGPSRIRPEDPESPVAKLLGGPVLGNKARAAQASPITYVSKSAPPFLIMHGDQDPTVPIGQSEALYQGLQKAGADVTFIPIKGAGHGFGPNRPDVAAAVKGFLRRCSK